MTKQTAPDVSKKTVDIAIFTKTDAALAKLKEKFDPEKLPDVNTKVGYEFIKDAASELTSLRTSIEAARKKHKQPYLDYGKKIDAEAKRITASLVELEKPIKALKEEADKKEEIAKKKRIDDQRLKIDGFYSIAEDMRGKSSSDIQDAIEKLNARDLEDFYDLKAEAIEARVRVLGSLGDILNEAISREKMSETIDKQKLAQEIEARINKLKSIPLDMLGKPSAEIKDMAESINKYRPDQSDFGDRFEEMLREKSLVVTRLELMAEQQRQIEEMPPQTSDNEDLFDTPEPSKKNTVISEKVHVVSDDFDDDLDDDFDGELTPYQQGYIDGLSAYAWWKNGVQYVGTADQTLDAAVKLFLKK